MTQSGGVSASIGYQTRGTSPHSFATGGKSARLSLAPLYRGREAIRQGSYVELKAVKVVLPLPAKKGRGLKRGQLPLRELGSACTLRGGGVLNLETENSP